MHWNDTAQILPDNGQDIEVFHHGEQFNLRFERNLFWLPDMSMYIYYMPQYWRAI